jgi:hypothetical protein
VSDEADYGILRAMTGRRNVRHGGPPAPAEPEPPYVKQLLDVLSDPKLSDRGKTLFGWLKHYDSMRHGAIPREQTLADDLSWSVRKVRYALADLVAAGWISVEHHPGHSSRYRLNDHSTTVEVWQDLAALPRQDLAALSGKILPDQHSETDVLASLGLKGNENNAAPYAPGLSGMEVKSAPSGSAAFDELLAGSTWNGSVRVGRSAAGGAAAVGQDGVQLGVRVAAGTGRVRQKAGGAA